MEQPLAPRDFLRQYRLPQLVRINDAHLHQLNRSLDSPANATLSSTSSSRVDSSCSSLTRKPRLQQRNARAQQKAAEVNLLDIDQPFLLYNSYSSRQVIANTLAPDPTATSSSSLCDNSFRKTGPTLFIPESYPGWFSMVNSKGQTAGYFSLMDEVARAQVPVFLTRDDLVGYSVPSLPLVTPVQVSDVRAGPRGSSRSEVIRVPGGSVLRLLGVYEDVSALLLGNGKSSVRKQSLRAASKKRVHPPIPYLLSGRSVIHEPGARYVKCLVAVGGSAAGASRSRDGEVVFVPVNERGRFYVIAKKTSRAALYNQVYSMATLLRVIQLPATVQLIIGPKPRNNWLDEACLSGHQSISRGSKKGSSEYNFTAVLRLEDLRVREVILASTIRSQPFTISSGALTRSSSLSMSIRRTLRPSRYSKKSEEPVLLEFDLDSSFTFMRTFSERGGTLTSRKIPELVLNSIEYCNREGESWKKQIKVAHDIIPRLGSDSGCSSGDGHVSVGPINRHLTTHLSKSRPSIFDADFSGKEKTIRNASIGSRASSNASNSSKLGKILQRFWNPLRRNAKSGFSEIEEDELGEDSQNKGSVNNKSNIEEESGTEHVYESLRKSTKAIDDLGDYEAKFHPPAQKISRKQTVDLLFSEFQVDGDGYITKSPSNGKLKDDSIYNTVE